MSLICTKTVLELIFTYENKMTYKLYQTIYQVDVEMVIYMQTKYLKYVMMETLTMEMDAQTHVKKKHSMIVLNFQIMEVLFENMCDRTMFMSQNIRKSEMMATTQHLMAEMINEKLKLDGTDQHQ